MSKVKLATTWLDGCSGCHMSLLDIDEVLVDILAKVEIVYGPLVDYKIFPEKVDVALVEGAVSSEADQKHIRQIRARTGILVSFGDCAITANVPGMRNRYPVDAVIHRAYVENAESPRVDAASAPGEKAAFTFTAVPQLCRQAKPVHEFVDVDVFLPGCPPPPAAIIHLLTELLAGRIPDMAGKTRFGA